MSLATETGHCGAVDPESRYSCWHKPGHLAEGIPHASMSGEHRWWTDDDDRRAYGLRRGHGASNPKTRARRRR